MLLFIQLWYIYSLHPQDTRFVSYISLIKEPFQEGKEMGDSPEKSLFIFHLHGIYYSSVHSV